LMKRQRIAGLGNCVEHAQEGTMKRRSPTKRLLRTRKQVRYAFDFEEYESEWIVGGGSTNPHPEARIRGGVPDRGQALGASGYAGGSCN
jgi:hypothetical protein